MRLRLHKLQAKVKQARKTRAKHPRGWDNIDSVLYYQGLLYVPEIIRTELISRHYNNLLASHFGIKKTRELVAQKYYRLILRRDNEDYVKGYDVCLTSKAVRYKPYGDLQFLLVSTHRWKNLSIDFVTGLPILTDWKGNNYNSILVIVNWLIKMVHYKPVKVTINVIVKYHGLLDSIVTDRGLFFTSKFWSLLCYFLSIKRRLSTAFHPQTDGQTKRQNNTIKAYFQTFVNFK